ncbi:ATP synthase F0 subunit B [Desulfococcaceae bacterium HSG7]|nr:ATP synthase F0 subunit B [Desulfococcaceae bacterium HSG7]
MLNLKNKLSIRRPGWILLVAVLFVFIAASVYASGGGDEEHGATAPKGWVKTDTYRVYNFAVLFIGLFLLLRKPVANALGSRIKGIKEQLAGLEGKQKETEIELAQYEKKLTGLESESDKIITQYIEQGKEAQARILQEAESEAVKLEEQARRAVEYEFKQAKNKLKEDALAQAFTRAEEVIINKITDDDQDKLIASYLNKVVA